MLLEAAAEFEIGARFLSGVSAWLAPAPSLSRGVAGVDVEPPGAVASCNEQPAAVSMMGDLINDKSAPSHLSHIYTTLTRNVSPAFLPLLSLLYPFPFPFLRLSSSRLSLPLHGS